MLDRFGLGASPPPATALIGDLLNIELLARVRNERPTVAFVPDHMGQHQQIFQGAGRVSSSRHGDEKRSAAKQSAAKKGAGEAPAKGVTRIIDDRDPIAAALRRVYDDAATEPLPEDLNRLLRQLEAAEKDA